MPVSWFIGTWVDGSNVNKTDIRNGLRDFVPLYAANATEFQALTTAGIRRAIVGMYSYTYNPSDTTTASDGARVLVTADGNRYFRDAAPSFQTSAIFSTVPTTLQASQIANASITPNVQIQGTSDNTSADLVSRFSADASGPFRLFAKSRHATNGSHTVVQSGDVLGAWSFAGSDGTNFAEAARITASVDGTPGTNDMPGRIAIATTPPGAETPVARLQVDAKGNVVLGATSALATTATDGFAYAPGMPGTPTGVPTTYTGKIPVVVDTSTGRLRAYIGSTWVDIGKAAADVVAARLTPKGSFSSTVGGVDASFNAVSLGSNPPTVAAAFYSDQDDVRHVDVRVVFPSNYSAGSPSGALRYITITVPSNFIQAMDNGLGREVAVAGSMLMVQGFAGANVAYIMRLSDFALMAANSFQLHVQFWYHKA